MGLFSGFLQTLGNAAPYAANALAGRQQGQRVASDRQRQDLLQEYLLQQQAEQRSSQAALQSAQMGHLNAQTKAIENPPPRNPVMGSPEWKAAKAYEQDLKPKPKPNLVKVTKPDNSVTFVDPAHPPADLRERAPAQGEDRTLVPVQQPDGDVVYVSRAQAAGKQVPKAGGMGTATLRKAVATNQTQLSIIDDAVSELDRHPQAVGTKRGAGDFVPFLGGVSDKINQHVDPEGVNARASLANIASLVIHDRSGAAVTVSEFPRLAPFVPRVSDDPATAKKKLAKLKQAIQTETAALEEQMGGGKSTGAPHDEFDPVAFYENHLKTRKP